MLLKYLLIFPFLLNHSFSYLLELFVCFGFQLLPVAHLTALQINTESMIVSEIVFSACLWSYVLRNELYLQGDPKSNDELKSEPKAPKLVETDTQMIDQLPQVETIGIILCSFHWIHFVYIRQSLT